MNGANLKSVNLSNANLNGANLKSARLYSANLRGASLVQASLYYSYLFGADLTDADLSGATVANASFGYNQGISEIMKRDLVSKGATFQDSLGIPVKL